MNEPRTEGEVKNELKVISVRLRKSRKAYTCDHCERQYDDSICDDCLENLIAGEQAKELLKSRTDRRY